MSVATCARALLAAFAAAAAIVAGGLLSPGEAKAARGMELAIQDDGLFLQGRKGWGGERAFNYIRALGVTRIRVNLLWAYTMGPSQYGARKKPKQIYYQFGQVDELIDRAAKNGIRVHLSLTGPAPRWANARRAATPKAWYKPSAREFGLWSDVVAKHFAGRVDRYSIWNEPNWKTWLGPLNSAPATYRQLYSRGYTAIKKADRRAKVLIGETSPFARPGMSTAPLAFLRKVACVDKKYKHRKRSCPKLKADGYAHHPYDFRHSPSFQYPGADNVTIGTLSRLTKGLDKLRKSGALRTSNGSRMPVYLTEYGYFANGKYALGEAVRSAYLRKAFTMAQRDKSVVQMLQFSLVTPPLSFPGGYFDLSVVRGDGTPYPAFDTLRAWAATAGKRGQVKLPSAPLQLPPAPASRR
jgi:hypothetical protein